MACLRVGKAGQLGLVNSEVCESSEERRLNSNKLVDA